MGSCFCWETLPVSKLKHHHWHSKAKLCIYQSYQSHRSVFSPTLLSISLCVTLAPHRPVPLASTTPHHGPVCLGRTELKTVMQTLSPLHRHS